MTVFEYKEMRDFEEYDILESIQEDAWGMPARELVPKRLIYATLKSGGVVIGAYKNSEIIGYCWGWVGNIDPYGPFIYSHHNAVRKEYQNQGVGLSLKLNQRKWAIEKGYKLINWTFDPLQSKNCYLNLHKLGVICNNYKRNYWGVMRDDLNRGIDTDRLYCIWHIASEHVEKRIQNKFKNFAELIQSSDNLVLQTRFENNRLIIEEKNLTLQSKYVIIEIPSNFIDLLKSDKQLLIQWRHETRIVFENYFNKGYIAIDFAVQKEKERIRCFHVLKREKMKNLA